MGDNYDAYFDELMNDKSKRDAHFKREKELWSKKPNQRKSLSKAQIESLKRLGVIK